MFNCHNHISIVEQIMSEAMIFFILYVCSMGQNYREQVFIVMIYVRKYCVVV